MPVRLVGARNVSEGAQPRAESQDFSIVLGGPIYQLYRKAHLTGTGLDLLKRRLFWIPMMVWAPLVLLSIVEGRFFGGTGAPLLRDIDVHARCLVAIPLMLLAELVAHRRLSEIVRQFVGRGLVATDDLARFEQMKSSAMRLRNSIPAELAQVALAIGLHWVMGRRYLLGVDSWLGRPEGDTGWDYTGAGWWYAFVTLTVFRVLLFRWYYRTFIWYRFLWQVRRLDLKLDALHPDRSGGLGFLAASPAVFMPLFLAHSVLVAAVIQNKIWSTGAKLDQFHVELGGVVVFLAVLAFTPLFFFAGKANLARRAAIAEYGALASRYVAAFREKWMSGRVASGDALVGSADIQSLADLSGAWDAVRETRLVPLTRHSFVQLIVGAGIPLVPLALNLVGWKDLLQRAAGFLF